MISSMSMVIGESQKTASSGEWLEVTNPATEQVQARVPHASSDDVDEAVRKARQAFEEGPWSRLSPTERGKLLYRLADLIDQHREELALMETQDMGKPYQDALQYDVPTAVEFLVFYAGFCDKIRGSQVPCGPDRHAYIVREPVGVVAGIVPWNFPLLIAIQKLGPALSCGNTLVLKPASESPRSALRLGELALEAGLASTLLTSFYNSGQICTAGSRLLVSRQIHDRFLDDLTNQARTLTVGDPMQEDTKLGPLVSRQQYERVTGYIEVGKQEFSPIVCGRRPRTLEQGFYVDPTIFDRVNPEARIAQEEIFGPVLSVIDFDGEEEAVRIANQTSYGLATALWTQDLSRAHRMAARIDSGFVWINCNNFWISSIPYEGHRQSGVGADLGVEAVESYTKLKSIIVNLDRSPHPWVSN